jgi:hypothetical protein
MMKNFLTTWSVKCLTRAGLRSGTRIDALPLWCGSTHSSGVNEVPEWQDWTEQETTPDQARIEDVLQGAPLTDSAILHVGLGNSGFAKRFHMSAHIIDGITIQEKEYRHALGLSIANYRPTLDNKYSEHLAARLNRKYDFIVDNNPTTFCCCRRHLATMLATYATLLKPDGVILTDVVGLHWTSEPNDPRWKLTDAEWWALGALFGLEGVRYTEYVIGLKKRQPWRPAFHIASGMFRRSKWPRRLIQERNVSN